MDTTPYTVIPPGIERMQLRAVVVGVAGLVLLLLLLFFSPGHFFHSYLVGYVFWVGIAVGSLAFIMLHHMSGGAWGIVIRRPLEAATRTLPLLAVLFVPIIVGMLLHYIFRWADPHAVEGNALLEHKRPYLNMPFFLARAVFYFVAWGGLAYFLNKWSLEQDRTADPRLRDKLQNMSGPGLILFGLTVTFAAVDWVMSLEPEWFSTIFGLLIMVGWGLSAFAFVIAVLVWLAPREPFTRVLHPSHFHDLGKLLLAFVMIWAYFSFSQFLLIWYANIPEETPWYLRRFQHGWQWVGLALVILHFALPFVLLLSRDLKRNTRTLSKVALLLIVMRVVDLIWLIAPAATSGAHHNGEAAPPGVEAAGAAVASSAQHGADPALWLDLTGGALAVIGLGGIWLAYFAWELKKRPLLPVNDPGFERALTPSGHH